MDYIDFEATVEEINEVVSEDEVSDVDSLKPFVDDFGSEEGNDRKFYRNFENVTRPTDEALRDSLMRACVKLNNLMKFQTFVKVLRRKARCISSKT